MSVQVKRRRDTAANLATFTGAQAELLVDTTNNRIQVHDGTTPGGWPAAKLAEVVTNTRTAISDANHTALASDRTIAFTALTAPRIVTLPAASTFPTGTSLVVLDESGLCSATSTITLAAAGTDSIDGAANAVLSSAYGYLALQSNGSNKWTIVDQATSNLMAVGIGTAADPGNPLSVYAANALFASAGDIRVKLNKAASSNTASFLYQDGWSGRAEIGLAGDDNFHFKVSPDGSTWKQGILIDSATGAVTLGNARTAVSDVNYTAIATDRTIAYTAITATRTVSLPAASVFPAGTRLTIVDESGNCSATNTITIATNGSDTLNGAASAIISQAYGYLALESNGGGKWTIVEHLAFKSYSAAGKASFGGYVGVGTSSPGSPLHIVYANNTYLPGLQIQNSATGSPSWARLDLISGSNNPFILYQDQNGNGNIGSVGSNNLNFNTANVTRATLNSGGNLGVGTTTPQGLLHVVAAANDSLLVRGHESLANGASLYSVNSANTAVEGLEIAASALFINCPSVGIATSSPSVVVVLDVAGALRAKVYTVGTLPAGVDGARAFVSDSTVAAAGNFGAAVAGGAGNHVPVYYDGGTSTWRIG